MRLSVQAQVYAAYRDTLWRLADLQPIGGFEAAKYKAEHPKLF